MSKIDVEMLFNGIMQVATSKKGQKIICGTYSNGKPRSMIDAIRDEYISPEDRVRWDKMKKAKKKKRKKNKKKYKNNYRLGSNNYFGW